MRGAVLYRVGRPAEAIDRCREGIAMGDGRADVDEVVFLAMGSFRAGDRARARSQLGRLGDEGPDGPSSEAWWNVRARRLLRREAVRLILDPDFPEDPFAH